MVKVKKSKFYGVYRINGKLATINLVPGVKTANEELININGIEYRLWDPYTSKPAAAIKRGLKIFPIEDKMKILYLGLASAKTATFFSDIIGKEGLIWGIEFSSRVLREAITPSEVRGNIIPILADARQPELYESMILEKTDCVYCDVADPDQIKILIRNCEKFLKPNGYAIIVIKSQSIDVTKPPQEVYRECINELTKHFKILDKIELDPYEKYHLFLVMKWKKIVE